MHSLLQTALVLLNVSWAAGAHFGDDIGQLFRFGVFVHAHVETTNLHPLLYVLTRSRLVRLQEEGNCSYVSKIKYHADGESGADDL